MTSAPPPIILLIDDNPFLARSIQEMCVSLVSGDGAGWGWAATPAEGLAQTERLCPTLVLLDPALHADESVLEDYCRELAHASNPPVPALLFLTNPGHQLDGLISRLSADGRLAVDSLSKPFAARDLTEKLTDLRSKIPDPETLSQSMSNPNPSRFGWLSTTPEVSGYAHLNPEGTVLEWMGEERHQGPHGALVYIQQLATLCGEDLGFGPAEEVRATGPEGCAFSLHLADGSALNVIASPRANLKAIATQAIGIAA